MKKPHNNHNFIEYIMTLLDLPENRDTDIADLFANDGQASQGSGSLSAAYEMIQFMDEMPGGFLIYHADGEEQIIYANKALLRIFGCDSLRDFRDLTGNSFKGIVHEEDLATVEASIHEQIATSQYDLDYVEYRITRKDGTVRWVEDYGHFIHSASMGDIFYVFISDTTEEKEIINQEHLRRLEVIEGLSINYESILFADLDENKITPYRLSSRTRRQFDYKYKACGFLWYISDYVNTWVYPEDRERVLNATSPEYIKKKLSENKTYYINYRIIMEGRIQFLHLRIVNVGSPNHISQIVMGYRRIDEEILREVEQKQILEDALSSANLAIVAKNAFLSNMSHDMRTPLNAIFGYTALAKNHIEDQQLTNRYLDEIDLSSHQLLDLIDKVLEIAWTESNDIRIAELECNLIDIMQEIYDSLYPLTVDKNISFSLSHIELKHPDVYSDPDRLRQLLQYLINNAIKYTKNDGKVDLSIQELDDHSNDHAVYQFVVQDTGIGISEEFLDHIFEPFEREKNTTLSNIHGAGLGLTIAKSIANMMGGDIKVSSAVDEGSTFTVTLRLRIQANPVPHTVNTARSGSYEDLTGRRILLVEDNEINLEIETEILKSTGFLIETAEDGSIAVEMIKNSKPGYYSLVLMDIQMPIMNGYQAASAIRRLEDPDLAHIPIIALSANAFESDKQMSYESGMDEHLTKPIDIPMLLETISRILLC